jgi:hypothetical protein
MKSIHIVGGMLVLSAGLLTPVSSQAQQFTTISQVLSECPDLAGASACVEATVGFVGAPNSPSDPEISTLALSLAQAAQFPRVPMRVCLNTADGIRILAQAADSDATAQQLLDIADSLCLGVGTAAIGSTEPPVSLVAVDPDDDDADTQGDTNGGSTNGGSTNGGGTNGGGTNGGNGGHGNGGHGNGGDDNGGHGNGGHGNGGHGNGGHGNGGHGNGGHGNGGHGNGGHGNGGDDNGGHGNGGHGNGGHGNGGHDNGGHDKD